MIVQSEMNWNISFANNYIYVDIFSKTAGSGDRGDTKK